MTVSIPQIDIPHFLFGDNDKGVGRGPGKEGDVIGREPKPGQSKGPKAGDQPGEGINISVDMDTILHFMQEELQLPRMRPKPNETFEEVKIKYNDISKNGPESLRHTRRTMKEAIKRMAASGTLDNRQRIITPVNSDFRYRQYKEIKIPTSNAVIFFARDCSGSMDDFRCDIVSDMAWWLDCWIRKFYKKVDRNYFVHDTRSWEVNEEEFYTYRMGGGTQCSSAFRAIADQLENKYPPQAYNVYIFYFTDGDNWGGDNDKMLEIMNQELGPERVNMIGLAQICSWSYDNSVKHFMDQSLKSGKISDYMRTTYVGPDESKTNAGGGFGNWGYTPDLSEEERNSQIIQGIKDLLGKEQYVKAEVA